MAASPPPVSAADRLRLSAAACFHPGTEEAGCRLDFSGHTVTLNESAGEILRRCNGELTVRQLIDELVRYYDGSSASDIAGAVLQFLAEARARGWVDLSADLG